MDDAMRTPVSACTCAGTMRGRGGCAGGGGGSEVNPSGQHGRVRKQADRNPPVGKTETGPRKRKVFDYYR